MDDLRFVHRVLWVQPTTSAARMRHGYGQFRAQILYLLQQSKKYLKTLFAGCCVYARCCVTATTTGISPILGYQRGPCSGRKKQLEIDELNNKASLKSIE
jgi:hypothetical protein